MTDTSTTPVETRRGPTILLAAVIGLARTSSAAFTASTANNGNSFSIGSIELTDNDGGSALFTVPAMAPGDSSTSCIQVTYNGTITPADPVKLYLSNPGTSTPGAGGGTADGYLDLSVEEGTGGGAFNDCTGFTKTTDIVASDLGAFPNSYATGAGSWTPTGGSGQTRTYRFTAALDAATPDTVQGAEVTGVEFTWEARS